MRLVLLGFTLFLAACAFLLALVAPAQAQGLAPSRSPLTVSAELADTERPAAVALTTSYTLLALTLRPLAEAAGDDAARAEPAAAPAPSARERARRSTGRVIDPAADRDAQRWLVRLGLFVLAGLAVVAVLLELARRADTRAPGHVR